MTTPSVQPAAPLCQCGHARDAHTGRPREASSASLEGSTNCTRCPSSGIWVDSMADWVYPCERFQPR